MATLSHAELAKKLMECAILVKRGEETPLIQETIQGLLEYAPKTVRITQEPKSSTVVAQAQKAVSNIKQKLKRDQHEEAPTSTRSTKTVIRSKPAFHRPSYQSNSALLVNGWIDQWRKSKFRSVWKQILASIVEARKPGQETTLWIQRQVETKDGQVELEALHQLPVVWIQQLEYPYAGDPLQFCISVHNLHDEFIFRTSSVEATQNWVSTIQSIVSNTKSKSTVAVPVTTINGLPARDTNRDTVVRPVRSDESNHPNDDDHDKPSLSKHRMSITELRAIAHGVGHSTAGMERSELETLVQHIAASSGINNAAAKTDPRTMTTSPVPPAPRSAPVPTTTTTTTAAPPRSVTPTLPKQRLPISELRALAHGAGISTVGMERQDLERVVAQLGRQQQNSAPPSQSSAPAPEPTQSQEEEEEGDDDEELQEQIKREEEEQRKQALAKERNRVEEERKERKRIVEERKQREAELQREQQQREQQEQADREQAEELRRLEQERLQVEEQAHQKRVAELQARKEQEQLRQQAAEQARKEEQKMRQQQAAYQEQQRQWQQQQAVAEEQRRQQEAATRRLQESNRQAQARAQQYAAPPHPQSHPQQHPQNPHAAQQQAWHHHQQQQQHRQQQQQQQAYHQQQAYQQQQQQQHRPQPPPNGHHPPHPPTPSKYAKIAQQQQQQQQAGTQAIKHHILVTWALQPPLLQILRPIETLLSTIHTVFPPHCGVPGHAHFAKWNTIALQDVYDPSNSRPDDEKLKKCVRKLRFFLHPDKLPKDLDTEQTFVCKLLWDVTNDAWEEHKNRQDDLGWIQS